MNHERAAPLISDYVLGRLDEADRHEIGRHLSTCADCREILEGAQELREVLRSSEAEQLLAHVQSQHLVRYAVSPGGMDAQTASWIRDHLEGCTACREAVEILREPEPATTHDGELGRAPTIDADRTGLWRWIGRTVLHPAPALAYLLLLVAFTGVWLSGRGSSLESSFSPTFVPSAGDVQVLPPAVPIYPVEQFRSDDELEGQPVEIALGADQVLHLQLHTEIEDELDELDAAFRLDIASDGGALLSRELATTDLSEFGVLQLILPADLLESGATYRMTIRLDRPGSSHDGDLLFERTFRLVRSRQVTE